MSLFVARQPIFDSRGNVFAYELLFRPGPQNVFGPGDRDRASAAVIDDSLRVFGFDTLTAGRRAFVNVTRQVLVEGLIRRLPPERTVVEVLETVEADPEVVAAVAGLKQDGYLIALDDFVLRPSLEPLLPFADFLKIDFLETTADARRYWMHRLDDLAVRLLAEKVERRAHFDQALSEGFSYFQGYWLERPEMVQAHVVPPFKRHALGVLSALQDHAYDFTRLEALVHQAPGLADRLLEDLNGTPGLRGKIQSVRQAQSLLGDQAFRRWATLVAFAAVGEDRPRELVSSALVRARMCELVAQRAGLDDHRLFLAGLFTGLGGLVGRPLDALAVDLHLPSGLAGALLGRESSRDAAVVALALAYEHGAWGDVTRRAGEAGIAEDRLPAAFRQALSWATGVYPP